jgi:hypothetical protein
MRFNETILDHHPGKHHAAFIGNPPGILGCCSMRFHISILLACYFMPVAAMQGYAQEPLVEDDFNAGLTEQQWRQRVEDARGRSAEFVARARSRMSEPVQADEEDAKAADQRAMNDPSLKSGDIVVTSKGFLVFVGRDEVNRQPSDFKPATDLPAAQSPLGAR